jgi:DnaJ-class molecular chaperone
MTYRSEEPAGYEACSECAGRGYVLFRVSETRDERVECDVCLGSGEVLADE